MLSVTRIVEDIEAGRDSAEAAIARSRALIEAHEPALHAFAALAPAETPVATTGPLAGIAVGVKDIFDTYDMPTAYGSRLYAGYRPPADAPVVAMARARGAHVIGKTATTEFAFMSPAKTVNPHDTAHTPGGSSSGSAAAVAAGLIPAAIGTQTGGSVIRPAAFCGVAGYKPSFRLLPSGGMRTFAWTLDTTGLFAASARDVALLATLLTRRDLSADEHTSLPRIGLYRAANLDEAGDAMRAAVETVAEKAARAGAEIVGIEEPEIMTRARDSHATIQNYEAAISFGHDLAQHAESLSPILRDALTKGRDIAPEAYDAARRVARHARKAATSLFDGVDILLTPSAPGAAPRDLTQTGSPAFNKLWTLTGNPCVNIPGMRDSAGMPLGIQCIGRFGRDKSTLQAAAWLEAVIAG